jgi:hypothetical protein
MVMADSVSSDLLLHTAADTAELLHVSIKTLERWRLEGFGPRWVRAGRKPLYRLSDLRAWIAENTVGSTSEHRWTSAAKVGERP